MDKGFQGLKNYYEKNKKNRVISDYLNKKFILKTKIRIFEGFMKFKDISHVWNMLNEQGNLNYQKSLMNKSFNGLRYNVKLQRQLQRIQKRVEFRVKRDYLKVMKEWLKKALVFGNLAVIQVKFEERSGENQVF